MTIVVNIEPANLAVLDKVVLKITFRNESKENFYFLRWKTPFDAVGCESLEVKFLEEENCSYIGRHAKRFFDSSISLKNITPGESISTEVLISENYKLPAVGRYSVELEEASILGVFSSEKITSITAEMLEAVNFVGNRISVSLAPNLDLGEYFSAVEEVDRDKFKEPSKIFGSAPECPPTSTTCWRAYDDGGVCFGRKYVSHVRVKTGGPHHDLIRNAALKLSERFLSLRYYVRNDQTYRKWFGVWNSVRAARVVKGLRGIDSQRHCKRYEIYTTLNGCEPDTIAWFKISPDENYYSACNLCPRYFSLPFEGRDSQVGTLAHELSHGYGGNPGADEVYQVDPCLDLAKNFPDLAVQNADNYQFYLEDRFYGL